MISFIIFLIPTCTSSNHLYYFSAGILFIVSGKLQFELCLNYVYFSLYDLPSTGLIMLIGLIAYISILKAEIGSKLRPRSTLQPPLFKVTYGQSFFLFVFGFIATEFVGVLNIFLYIHLQEFNYYNVRTGRALSSVSVNMHINGNERGMGGESEGGIVRALF